MIARRIHSYRQINVMRSCRRGLSLPELLIAIFILGIGVISISALFPVGISQQKRAQDEIMGPVVAQSALSIIRSKLEPEFFGSDLDPTGEPAHEFGRETIIGDWVWRRPALYEIDDTNTPTGQGVGPVDETGGYNIFFDLAADGLGTSSEVFYNTELFGPNPPDVRILQTERYYPFFSQYSTTTTGAVKPDYVWDCMFRRFQGRIQVAVFVYRITNFGGEGAPYIEIPHDEGGQFRPFPMRLDLANPIPPTATVADAWDVPATAGSQIDGSQISAPFNFRHTWDAAGQWLLDQNNNIHRVLSNYEDGMSPNVQVELVRPPEPVIGRNDGGGGPTDSPNFYYGPLVDGLVNVDVVTDIWFIPTQYENFDDRPIKITPVYVLVEEL